LFELSRAIYLFSLHNTIIKNNEFKTSAIYIEPSNCSPVFVHNSKFISNIGEDGTAYYNGCSSGGSPHCIFNSTSFENNVARKHGGVFYYNKSRINNDQITDCIFYNNTAPLGI